MVLFSASLRFTPAGLARKFVPDEFLFSASLPFSPAGPTRKFVPDEFFVKLHH